MIKLRTLVLAISIIILFGTNFSFANDTSIMIIGDNNINYIESRIVGGDNVTDPNAYPWFVGLLKHDVSNNWNAQFCGGSYIGNGWILTAAHCFYDGNGTQIKFAPDVDVLTGTIYLDGSGTRIESDQVIIHPGYNDNTHENDIALIKLKSIPSIPSITLVTNDAAESADVGDIARVIGWGNTEDPVDPTYPQNLMEVDVPIVSNTTCAATYGSSLIKETNVCAGYEAGGKDSCQGDSGGPLFVNDGGTYKQNGIVSWGIGCAEPDYYGVYTRVSEYYDWINAIKSGESYALFTVDNISAMEIISDGQFMDIDGDGLYNFITHLFLSNYNYISGISDSYDEVIEIESEIGNVTDSSINVQIIYNQIKPGDRFYTYYSNNYVDITNDLTISGNSIYFTVSDGGTYDIDADTGEVRTIITKASLADDSDSTSSGGGGGGGCSTGKNSLPYLLVLIITYSLIKFVRRKNIL